jgi:hypothetical protein
MVITNLGRLESSQAPIFAPRPAQRNQAQILLVVAVGLFGTAVALSLISTPGPYGIPNYTYLYPSPAGTLIEGMVVLSSVFTAIGFAALFRWALLLVLLAGVTALVIFGALFVITFVDCVPVGTGATAICVQPYPQTFFVVVWALVTLCSLPVVWILQRQALRRVPRLG